MITTTYYVPPKIAAGLATGTLSRYGDTIRIAANGQFCAKLAEIANPRTSQLLLQAALGMLRQHPVLSLVSVAVPLVASAGVGALWATHRGNGRKVPDTLKIIDEIPDLLVLKDTTGEVIVVVKESVASYERAIELSDPPYENPAPESLSILGSEDLCNQFEDPDISPKMPPGNVVSIIRVQREQVA